MGFVIWDPTQQFLLTYYFKYISHFAYFQSQHITFKPNSPFFFSSYFKYLMQHFQATFFEMQRQLQKGDFGVEGAQGTTIKCRKEEIQNDEAKELWLDFTPCVDVPFWPDSGIEWYLRPRKRFQQF